MHNSSESNKQHLLLKLLNITVYLLGILSILTVVICCQDHDPHNLPDFTGDRRFEHLRTYTLTDTFSTSILIPNPHDFMVVDSTRVFFTQPFMRQIWETTLSFDKFTKIGTHGIGPGEYGNPAFLGYGNNQLFYTDYTNGLIESIVVYDEKMGGDIGYNVFGVSGEKFAVCYPYIAVLNHRSPYVSLYKIYSGEQQPILVEKFLEFPEYHWVPNTIGTSGKILFDSSGGLYVVTNSPYMVTVFAVIENDGETSITQTAQFDLSHNPYVIPWTQKKYNKLAEIDGPQNESLFMRSSMTYVHNALLLESDSKKVLLIQLFHPDIDVGEEGILLDLVSLEDGQTIKLYKSKWWLLGSYNDVVYLHDGQLAPDIKADIHAYRYVFGE